MPEPMLDRERVTDIAARSWLQRREVSELPNEVREQIASLGMTPEEQAASLFEVTDEGGELDYLERLLARAGRSNGPGILWDWHVKDQITREHLADLIAGVWSMAEYPERIFSKRGWLPLFRSAGFVSDPPGLPAPTEPLTIYRGAAPQYARGMSWTTDLENAQWFANRSSLMGLEGFVYVATVAPDAVLARCEGRAGLHDEKPGGEAEIVVDPDMLPRPVKRLQDAAA